MKSFVLLCALISAPLATSTVSAQTLGQCYASYNASMNACRGESLCEQNASLTLTSCLRKLVTVQE